MSCFPEVYNDSLNKLGLRDKEVLTKVTRKCITK